MIYIWLHFIKNQKFTTLKTSKTEPSLPTSNRLTNKFLT